MLETLAGSDLVEDYLRGNGRARGFFCGAPEDPVAYREKAGEVDERFGAAERRRAVELVSAPSSAAREKLGRIVEEEGYFVTTGQQPGLFGGPIYSLYKALGAVGRARALEELLDRPVVPLFWVASEDHDWAEVSHTWVVDPKNELREVALPPHDRPGEPPLHRVVLGEELDSARARLEGFLPETDFSPRYLELIRKAYHDGATLPAAFRTVLEELLGPFGLCFVEAHEPELKTASLPTLLAELDRAGEHEALLRERSDELSAAGYHEQVPILEGGVNLFLEGPAGRERLYRNDGGFQLRHSEAPFSRDEIEDRAKDGALALSPNAILRPVVESSVFPTLCYVAGPGEMAYFAQLSTVFESHGIRMPVIAPRRSITVVEAKNRKVLEKFDLDLADLARPFHELASAVARDEVPDDVERAIGEFRGAVARHSRKLLDSAAEVDPTLKGPIEGARNASFQALDEVEKKIVQAVKRQDEIALRQLEKVQVHLFPRGLPQERVMNPLYFLVRYGDDFLDAVADACLVDLGEEGA